METCVRRLIFLAGLVGMVASATAGEVFTLVEHVDNEHVVAKRNGKDNLGDVIIFRNSLYDAANKVAQGRDNGYCVRTEVGESYHCTMTLSLSSGDLLVSGPFNDKGDSLLVVAGGTGKHLGATGSMKIHSVDEKNYVFVFELK